MSAESRTPRERDTQLASWFMSCGIVIGWISCSLFWLYVGWLP